MKNLPVGWQAEGNITELKDLIEGEGKRNKDGREQGERESEGGHGKKEDVSEENEDVMERDDAFPAEAGKEGHAPEFSILRERLEIHHEEIGKGEEGQWNGEREETMDVFCLDDKCNGRDDIGNVNGEKEFPETAVNELEWREGVKKDDREGNAGKEEGSK